MVYQEAGGVMADTPGFTPITQTVSTPGFTPVGATIPTSNGELPRDEAARQGRSRSTIPQPDERGGLEKALDWGRESFLGRAVGAAGEEATNIGKSAIDIGKGILPSAQYPFGEPGWKTFAKMFIDPAKQKFASAAGAFKEGDTLKGSLGVAGAVNPFSPDLVQLYETASKDPAEALGKGGMDIFTLAAGDAKLREHLSGIRRIAEQQPAINQGYVGLNRSVQNAAHIAENNLTGPNGAIGRHATSVIQQSALDAKMKSLPGEVPTADAAAAGQKQADLVKRPDMVASHPPWYTMAEAKDVISRIGKQAIKFDNSGKAAEGSVLWAEYDALRKSTQARATALGSDFGRSWKYYIDEFHNYMQVRKGLLGDVLDAQTSDDHIAAMKKLTGGEGPAIRPETSKVHPDVPRVKQWLKQYGADPKLVEAAVEQGQQLNKLTQQSKNFFMSKLRGFVNHPILAGVPGVAAGGAAAATGIPLAHFVVPLIVVGRIAGLLDAAEATKLVRQIAKRVGPENMHGIPAPQGEPPMPTPPSASAVATSSTLEPTTRGPERRGSTERRGTGVDTGEQAERRSQTQPERRTGERRSTYEMSKMSQPTEGEKLAEEVRKARAGEPSGIVEGDALRRIMRDPTEYKKYADADQKTRDAMLVKAKNELQAEQVKGARSVYKGKRR